MKEVLHLDLTIQSGHEVRAAKELCARLTPQKWALLAALAAEIVSVHEAATSSAVILVVGADQMATQVKKDLQR